MVGQAGLQARHAHGMHGMQGVHDRRPHRSHRTSSDRGQAPIIACGTAPAAAGGDGAR